MNAYHVQLVKPVKMEPTGFHFSGRETNHLVAVASSYEAALAAVRAKYPAAEIRGISAVNYDGIPIVMGE